MATSKCLWYARIATAHTVRTGEIWWPFEERDLVSSATINALVDLRHFLPVVVLK